MRFFHELRVIMHSLVASFTTLLWTLLMWIVIEYMFALVFMQAVTSYLSQDTHDDTVKANLLKYWGTVLFSMESLFKAATGGTDWEVVATPLKHAGWGYYV